MKIAVLPRIIATREAIPTSKEYQLARSIDGRPFGTDKVRELKALENIGTQALDATPDGSANIRDDRKATNGAVLGSQTYALAVTNRLADGNNALGICVPVPVAFAVGTIVGRTGTCGAKTALVSMLGAKALANRQPAAIVGKNFGTEKSWNEFTFSRTSPNTYVLDLHSGFPAMEKCDTIYTNAQYNTPSNENYRFATHEDMSSHTGLFSAILNNLKSILPDLESIEAQARMKPSAIKSEEHISIVDPAFEHHVREQLIDGTENKRVENEQLKKAKIVSEQNGCISQCDVQGKVLLEMLRQKMFS